jgi:hypothetical protein
MMTIVNKDPDDLLQDEGILVSRPDGKFELMFRCPKCNRISASKTGNHIYNPKTNSIKPSVICPCGFHKTLTNGVWS